MRKLVVAEICLLSLMLSVTTGSRCVKEERTHGQEESVVNSSSEEWIKRYRELEIYRRDRGFV